MNNALKVDEAPSEGIVFSLVQLVVGNRIANCVLGVREALSDATSTFDPESKPG